MTLNFLTSRRSKMSSEPEHLMKPSMASVMEPFSVDLTSDTPPEPLVSVRQYATFGDEIKIEPMSTPSACFAAPPEDAWVIVQSLATAFALGGLVGGLLVYSFSKREVFE